MKAPVSLRAMRRLVAFALIALAGCSVGGDEKSIDEARVDDLLLQPADVGRGFQPTYGRNLADRPVAEVRYRRARAPLSIESAAHVFVSSEAAGKRLDAERSAIGEKPGWQPIGEPGLGDESFAATLVQAGTRSYTVFWRQGNATASLGAVAREDELPFADVLELARKQQRRMADAAA
jgi:hypothetical protein